MVSETVAKVLETEKQCADSVAKAKKEGEENIAAAYEYAEKARAEMIEKAKEEADKRAAQIAAKAEEYAKKRSVDSDVETARIKSMAAEKNDRAADAVIKEFFG